MNIGEEVWKEWPGPVIFPTNSMVPFGDGAIVSLHRLLGVKVALELKNFSWGQGPSWMGGETCSFSHCLCESLGQLLPSSNLGFPHLGIQMGIHWDNEFLANFQAQGGSSVNIGCYFYLTPVCRLSVFKQALLFIAGWLEIKRPKGNSQGCYEQEAWKMSNTDILVNNV